MLGLSFMTCGSSEPSKAPLAFVSEQLEKLAPVELECDLSKVSETDRQVLAILVQAAELIDQLFLLQVHPQNPQIRETLTRDPHDRPYLELFDVMFGPWNRLEEDKPFIGTKPKPAGAGFYPEDMSKEELLDFMGRNPDLAAAVENNFTIIQRTDVGLSAVPYHQHFAVLVQKVADLLQEAAAVTQDQSLKTFLELRAQAFLNDDYFASDLAWMDLSGDLEVVIGPYEVYEDKLFNYKAAYEAFLCIVDHEESAKLEKVSRFLNEMEANLPIPDDLKNFNRGSSSPIKVVQEVFSAGDTKAGIQTMAFNLPNDERVREAKGSKKVMLKNIAKAKFEKCWLPIVNTILAQKPLQHVSFDSYFNHVLIHEMSHGLGPGNIVLANGVKTTVQKELKELYSVIEECKADVLGIYNLKFLMDQNVFDRNDEYSMYASYLGGMMRSIRFGIDEAHGGGVAIQFNYCMEQGAFLINPDGKLDLDETKIYPALRQLASELLTIQGQGDYAAAQRLVQNYRVMTPVLQNLVAQLDHVPVDIRPKFTALEELAQIR